MSGVIKIALAGNPNCGKSTVFNALTGAQQHVGNWPGKTVEKKEGKFSFQGQEFNIVDLPGTYSLTAYSAEEIISRDFILNEDPDVVVSVVDAGNLERNLYLTFQVMELEVPTILALNMMDSAEDKKVEIDVAELEKQLGIPVVPMVARERKGIGALQDQLLEMVDVNWKVPNCLPEFDDFLEDEIAKLVKLIEKEDALTSKYSPRWLAVKLLEEDCVILEVLAADARYEEILNQAVAAVEAYQEIPRQHEAFVDTDIADARYQIIHDIVKKSVKSTYNLKDTFSDKVDRILTHEIFGIPIFLGMMWIVFKLTTDVAGILLDWVDSVISGPITNWVVDLVNWVGLGGSWFESMLVDGVIAGVGGVLVFVPVMMWLYLALALMEDSGYMARAAFVMDRAMHVIGLHGKSFMPMVVGFGCTVPAIYATRTLENEKDRILTGLLVPFMSCGARMPVYILFSLVFFPQRSGLVIFSLYLLGILMAIGAGFVLKRTVFKTDSITPFVMELPSYRRPTLRGIWAYIYTKVSSFVRRAWGLIMVTSVILWFLMAIPVQGQGSFADVPIEDSAFGTTATVISPLFAPAGFGSWEASSSLITGFVAKEVVVSTLSQVYGLEDASGDEDVLETTFLEDVKEIVTSFGVALWDTVKAIPLVVGIDVTGQDPDEDVVDIAFYDAIRNGFNESSHGHGGLASYAFMVFVLLYTPCMVAVAAMRQEFGAKWMWISVLGQFVLAWVVSVLIFQIGILFV